MRGLLPSILKIIAGLMLLGGSKFALAQNVPNGTSNRPSATATILPSTYTNSTINYIRTWEPSMPSSDPAAVSASIDVNAVRETTQYFDGLGRPLQTVTRAITPEGKDLVVPVKYDDFGREQYKYLPYVPKTGNTNDGRFKTDPFNGQKSFYQDASLVPGAVGENIYYEQTEYEASPLGRVTKSYAPGNTWAKNDPAGVEKGGNRPVTQQYEMNTSADGVRIWDISSGNIPTSSSGLVYGSGTLYKHITKDERGLRVIEFSDKEGKTVLKKVELTSGSADGHNGWLCTYYVYDELGNLRFVIPPKAVGLIQGNWTISQTIADELCFQYEYDSRNRSIAKKLPGAAVVEMVYDVRDRLVFSRDGNLKVKSQWLVTFYDGRDNPIMTALYNSSVTRNILQTNMNTAINNNQNLSYTFPGIADLVAANYDGRPKYEATNSISFENGFEVGDVEMVAEINSSGNQGITSITVTNPLPDIPASALTPLTYTFYDDYSFTGKQNALIGDFSLPRSDGSPYAEIVSNSSSQTKGLITGRKIRVLGTDQWLTTTIYYTDKGRTLQTISDNVNGGKDIETSLYDFSGIRLSTYLRHNNPHSAVTPQITVMKQELYDAAGRLKSIRTQLNDAGVIKTIAENSYNELGQLKTKRLGVTGANTQLETLDYEYNLQGWLKSINKPFVSTTSSTSNWFGQELSYDYGYTINQYNGNVAGIKWKSKSNGIQRSYGYSYDNANRLTVADFTQQNNSSSSWTRDQVDFSVGNLSYDDNGNIITMNQMGMIGTQAPQLIDQLNYSYKNSEASNRLAAVGDPKVTVSAKLGDFIDGTNTGDDYDYDVNGNLTKDLNKNITNITYNHLNLPVEIAVSGKGVITYQYDANGNKLSKTVLDNMGSAPRTTVTEYIGMFVYNQNNLELIGHEEGRIRPVYKSGQPVQYVYDYFEKDHLGNVRTVLTEQTDFTVYAATMETKVAAQETALFSNVEETRVEKPSSYPEDKTTNENKFVAKLNAKEGGRKVGPSLVLRVMSGDTVQVNARAFYKSQGPMQNNVKAPVEDMLADLIKTFVNYAEEGGAHTSQVGSNNPPFNGDFYNNDYQRLKEKDGENTSQSRPKAYLNFVLFDDNFKLVEDNSGVRQVKPTPDELQELGTDKMTISKSGFLYVYTSNETQQDVFFDNVVLAVNNGPLLEETHYYPFGLTMTGISSNAFEDVNYAKNRKGYNGIEHTSDLDLNHYDAFYRNMDPQIGRWWQLDPKPEDGLSLYAAMGNNPILKADFLGDTTSFGASRNQTLIVNGKKISGEQLAQRTIKEWSKIGNVKLEMNKKTGEVEFKGNQKGNYSVTGRREVMEMVSGQGQVTVDFSTQTSSHTSGNNITINPEEIDAMVTGTSSDLNQLTSSYGMVALHEFRHTEAAGGDWHGPLTMGSFGRIDAPDRIGNQIRSELSTLTGTNWGERASYTSMVLYGNEYMPYSGESRGALQRARAMGPSMRGLAQIPTRSVIITPIKY